MLDFDCAACGRRFEALVGGANAFSAPESCPGCGALDISRAWTFEGHVSQTVFLSPKVIDMHLRHKADLEEHARKGTLIDVKERGPLEFRPKFERTLH